MCKIARITQPGMNAIQAKLGGSNTMVAKFSPPSDTIKIHEIETGFANAGNGGNGTNNGAITDNAKLDFQPYNTAYGSDVHVNTGDHVHQTASWDAGGANGVSVDPPSLQHINITRRPTSRTSFGPTSTKMSMLV
jgi:hypothetical protein